MKILFQEYEEFKQAPILDNEKAQELATKIGNESNKLTLLAEKKPHLSAECEKNELLLKEIKNNFEATLNEQTNSYHSIIQNCVNELNDCKNRTFRYLVKDFFTSADARRRVTFIDDLTTKLTALKTNPKIDVQAILTFINKHKADFPGTHLQPALNFVATQLINLERTVNNRPVSNEVATVEEISQKLTALNNPAYKQAILTLYKHINKMDKYGQDLNNKKGAPNEAKVIRQLARELTLELDKLVSQDTLPTSTQYQQFKEDFTCRLHSQDKSMSTHRKLWKPIVANILIGICTLGLALVSQAIVSKLTQRHAQLFFSKTKRQHTQKGVEKELKQLGKIQFGA